MNREEIFYLIPYLISLSITLGVFLYTWGHRHVRGADLYLWFIGGQTLTVFGFIMELISPSLATKLMWDKFQWLTDSFLVFIPFLIFSISYSESQLRYPRLAWTFWLAPPIIFTALLATDSLHHLIYPDPSLSTDYPFPELKYSFTIAVYLYALVYVYGANFYGIGLLVKRAISASNPFRLQYLTVAGGFFIPLVMSFFTLANIRIMPQRDITPFTFAIGNMVVAWGLFRYKLFDIVPIARDRIVENLNDPMIVLDTTNRIVDINSAALAILGGKNRNVVGRSHIDVLKEWPDVIEMLEKSHEERREISVKTTDDTVFYDIGISPIFRKDTELIGHIIVARDITRQKALEVSYRILSDELEKRVKERTAELVKSEEKFHKAFEASPDGITLSEFNSGRLVEVNEGFEKVYGYRRVEVIGHTPLDLGLFVYPADRERYLQTIQKQGYVQNQEFKVKTKTGEERLVLVSAEQIEINGVKHIVAINRDITEQKIAENRILRLNRLYITISQINQTIIRARDRDTLFREICRVAIVYGQYRMAWIGQIDEVEQKIIPIAFAGEEQGYLENINIENRDTTLGRGPTGTAARISFVCRCANSRTRSRSRRVDSICPRASCLR